MHEFKPKQENEFYAILDGFLDLERNTARKYTTAEYNLDRMPLLSKVFHFPEEHLKIIHIAGTKGKGSVCGYLSGLLKQAGIQVGTFTSPHLTTFRERFQINGRLPDYETILKHTRKIEQGVKESGIDATFFEVLTILALSFFRDQGCEYAVLETGIGGKLDCTNYVPSPVCTGITAISYDHMALLGHTISEIAAQKAGIIKRGVPVVCGHQPFPEARAVIESEARKQRAPFYEPSPLPRLPQLADLPPFQVENLALAHKICDVCGTVARLETFPPPSIPGRFELVCEKPVVIIDAAHNADSAKRLVEAVRKQFPNKAFTCVVGMVAGKDVEGFLRELAALGCPLIFTHPRVAFKGSELKQLESLAEQLGLTWRSIPNMKSRTDLPVETPLIFTGSFFTASIGAELFAQPVIE